MSLTEFPTFSFIPHENMRLMLIDAMEAVTLAQAWDWLQNYPPHKGFIFAEDNQVKNIRDILLYKNHNNVSFGIVMGHMEYIAKFGWPAYVRRFKA